MLASVCSALADLVGVPVVPYPLPTPEALAQAFGAGRVDIAWVSPMLMLTSPSFADAEPLACSLREGLTAYHSVMFVRKDSTFRSVMDLRGTRAAWVSPRSASGCFFVRLALASYGLDPRAFFASESFLGSHGSVARAVLEDRADVGAVYAVFEGGNASQRVLRAPFLDIVPDRTGRVLLTTAPIPSDLIVASPSLHSRLLLPFEQALKKLHENAALREPMRHVFGADAFVDSDNAALDTLREHVETGLELGLIDGESV